MTILVEAIIGLILSPSVIDYVNKYVKDSRLRFGVTILVSLVAGVLLNLGELSLDNVEAILASAGIVFSAASVFYKTYWKDSNARVSLYGKK